MKRLIYNDKWIVCGHAIDVKESEIEERFNNIRPDDRVIITVNNREVLNTYFKNAYVFSAMIFAAALHSGTITPPFSNVQFSVINLRSGIVLLPAIEPFNRVIKAYQEGNNVFSNTSIQLGILKKEHKEVINVNSICPN